MWIEAFVLPLSSSLVEIFRTMKSVSLVFSILLSLLLSCKTERQQKTDIDPLAQHHDSALWPFYHGVASGDPLHDRVIIWTRVTPNEIDSTVAVSWEIAKDPNFASLYKSGSTITSRNRDFTVKVDVDALKPGQIYYYRFKALGKFSITGRTKTAPIDSPDSLKFAVVSCSNWEWGYFNAYDKIADRPVLDAVIHLGDYIYEYGVGKYGDTTIGRINVPPHELVTLQDYRTRYALYRTDVGLRRAHQQHPFIAIWDDHEVANNVYTEGAQNHQPEDGDFNTRKTVAKQAYYEWLPIRESKLHYRSFSFGSVADVIMLDERLEGRTKPVDSLRDPNYASEERHMLGPRQLAWLENNLKSSRATWKIVGNQVMISEIDLSPAYPKMPRNLDSWDGYPAERQSLKNFILNQKIKDVLFLTGDTHTSWAIEAATDFAKTYDAKTSKGAFAIELGTTSISSANDNEYHNSDTVKLMEQSLQKLNPHIKYMNARDHGYLLLTLSSEKGKAEWFFVETLRKQGSPEFRGKKFEFEKGKTHLESPHATAGSHDFI
jgi:alkaline phosphatase D